jgi:hypothetical protein
MQPNQGTVFYEEVHAETPEKGLCQIDAVVQHSKIVMCRVPKGKDPYTFANQMLENSDPRVGENQVACINITTSSHNKKKKRQSKLPLWLFFGWED